MMRIMKKRVLSPVGRRRLRVGRRAIASARMHRTLEERGAIKSPKRRITFRRPEYQFTKLHLGIACGVVILLIGSLAAYSAFARQQASERAKAEAIRIQKQRLADQKAAMCRADVVNSKTDQIGKVTYGELYGTSC